MLERRTPKRSPSSHAAPIAIAGQDERRAASDSFAPRRSRRKAAAAAPAAAPRSRSSGRRKAARRCTRRASRSRHARAAARCAKRTKLLYGVGWSREISAVTTNATRPATICGFDPRRHIDGERCVRKRFGGLEGRGRQALRKPIVAPRDQLASRFALRRAPARRPRPASSTCRTARTRCRRCPARRRRSCESGRRAEESSRRRSSTDRSTRRTSRLSGVAS